MRDAIRRWPPVLLAGLALALMFLGPATAAAAAAGRRPARPPAAPPAPAGWAVDRVRFEPLAGSAVGVDGLGDYRGAIEVRRTGGGLAVVNHVGLEDYVRGIAEVPNAWPAEALKAQAVAARTYALYEMGSRVNTATKAAGADICATEACQVYAGLAKERAKGGEAWAAAVAATAGQVVLYKGAPILAKYSSSNGGYTVPGGRPYLRAVPDPDDARSPVHQWRSALPLGEVGAALGVPAPIVAAERTPESIVVLRWRAGDGAAGEVRVAVPEFRARVNAGVGPPAGLPRPVPSHQFTVTAEPASGALILEGRGFGHGIGLSQFGALGKAMRGMRAPDILASYYAGLRPVALPADRLPAAVRVALDLDRAAATVVGSGQFRVTDGAGNPLAVAASGRWRIRPDGRGGGVRVIPAEGQDAAPALGPPVLDPGPRVPPGAAPTLTFTLTVPARVRVAVSSPGAAAPVLVADSVAQPGEVAVALPALTATGPHAVSVDADAGGGRVASALVQADVGPVAELAAASAPGVSPSAAERLRAEARAGMRIPTLIAVAGIAAVLLASLRMSLPGRRRLH